MKLPITLKTVFNAYGLFLVAGLFLSSFMHPLAAMDTMSLLSQLGLIMDSSATKEFSFFILEIGTLYFILVNLYFLGKGGRVLVFVALFAIGAWSIRMIFITFVVPLPH